MLSKIKWLELAEPARLRGIAAAVLALLVAVGVTTATELPGWVDGVLLIVGAVLPLVQGESTRAVVTPVNGAPVQTVKPDGDEPISQEPFVLPELPEVSA